MRKLLKNHAKIILGFIVGAIVVYLAIWLFFLLDGMIPTGNGLKKKDWLSFFGSFLTLIGTLFLGYAVYLQTERGNEINKRILNSELKTNIGYFLPKSDVKRTVDDNNVTVPYDYKLNKSLPLYNSGDSSINVIKSIHKINDTRKIEDDTPFFAPEKGEFTRMDMLLKLSEEELRFDKISIEMDIIMENLRGYRYKQTLYMYFTKNGNTHNLTGFNTKIADIEGETP